MMKDQNECISDIYEEKEDIVIITTRSSVTGDDESSDTVQLNLKKTTASSSSSAAAVTSKGCTASTLLPTTETDYGQIQRDGNNSDDDHEEDKKLRCVDPLPFSIIPTNLSNGIWHFSNHHHGRIRNIVYCFAGLLGLFAIGEFCWVDDHYFVKDLYPCYVCCGSPRDREPGCCKSPCEDDQFGDKPRLMSLEELLKGLDDEDDEEEDSFFECDDLLNENEVEDLIERLLLLET